MKGRGALAGLVPILLLVTLLAGVSSILATARREAWFLSGWILLATLAVVGVRWFRQHWRREPGMGPALPLVRSNLILLVLFLWHTGLRWPRGGFEIALTVLFGVYVLSAVAGHLRSDERGPELWSCVHEPVAYTLIPFALLHGVLAHAHGLLATTFGMSS